MHAQVAEIVEGFLAEVALVRLAAQVDEHVRAQLGRAVERLVAAVRAAPHARHGARVAEADVLFELTFTQQALIAVVALSGHARRDHRA